MSEHLSLYLGHQKIWDPEDNERFNGEVLEGAQNKVLLPESELKAVHEFILCNLQATETLRQ